MRGVAFAARGRRVVSCGYDRTIRVWDTESGKQIHQFDGHTGTVWYVTVSRDGRRALTGSDDRTVRLWGLPR